MGSGEKETTLRISLTDGKKYIAIDDGCFSSSLKEIFGGRAVHMGQGLPESGP